MPLKFASSSTHPEDVAAEAAGWVERLTSGEASKSDIAALREWLAADPENRRAYEHARMIWIGLPQAYASRRHNHLRLVGGTALAACFAFLLFLFPGFHDHHTGVGQVERITLPDGSTAWLDSDTALELNFDRNARSLYLSRGRVALEIAQNGGPPFIVRASDATIKDIGTTFAVDRTSGLSVAVEEGLVEVARGGRLTRLKSGEAGSFKDVSTTLRPVRPNEFDWRDGRLLMHHRALGEALVELDRYYSGRIILLDGDLSNRRVSGTLFVDRPAEGVEALARSQNLKVTHLPWLMMVSTK